MATEQTQTGDNQQAAAGQGQNQQQNQQTPIPDDLKDVAKTDDKGQVMVPLAALTDERTKRQTAEGQVKTLEDEKWMSQVAQISQPPMQPQGQQPQQQQMQQQATGTQFHAQPQQTHMAPVQQQPQVPTLFEGMNNDEMLTVEEVKSELNKVVNFFQNQQPVGPNPQDLQVQGMQSEMILRMIAPDAEQVLMGGFRQALAANPNLAATIQSTHPALRPFVAYRIGKGQSEQQAVVGAQQDIQSGTQQMVSDPNATQQAAANVNQTTQKIIDNANKPTPTTTVVGAGGLNQVDRFNAMDDDEIEAEIARVKGG